MRIYFYLFILTLIIGCEKATTEQDFLHGTFTDVRDGQEYKWVQIGDQIWMMENLNYITSGGSSCLDCPKYGRLYDWTSALTAAPPGWHLPSKEEWYILRSQFQGSDISFYDEIRPGGSLHFDALLAGLRWENGYADRSGTMTCFWSSTEANEYGAYVLAVYGPPEDPPEAYVDEWPKNMGFSIRCIRDTTTDLPAVGIATVSQLTDSSAMVSAKVYTQGASPITSRGICWSMNENPTVSDFKTEILGDTGIVQSQLSGLEPFTSYYVRAYAVNGSGTAYGLSAVFTTYEPGGPFGSFIDPRDQKTYGTVQIGSSIWMTSNLNFETDSGSGYYSNNISFAASFGRLYTFEAALVSAPPGWHLPTDTEWHNLFTTLGGEGINMPTYNRIIDGGSSGLNMRFGGAYLTDGFHDIGNYGYFWTADAFGDLARTSIIGRMEKSVTVSNLWTGFRLSVRCVRD